MKKALKQKIQELENNENFVDFYCYHEDRWLGYASWEQKLTIVFGSVENAIKAFDEDEFFNPKNM